MPAPMSASTRHVGTAMLTVTVSVLLTISGTLSTMTINGSGDGMLLVNALSPQMATATPLLRSSGRTSHYGQQQVRPDGTAAGITTSPGSEEDAVQQPAVGNERDVTPPASRSGRAAANTAALPRGKLVVSIRNSSSAAVHTPSTNVSAGRHFNGDSGRSSAYLGSRNSDWTPPAMQTINSYKNCIEQNCKKLHMAGCPKHVKGKDCPAGIPWNVMQGNIPWNIIRLKRLTYLNLKRNNLVSMSKTVSEGLRRIGYLKKLTRLDLSVNRLRGEIPSEFGKLTALTYLNLAGNFFTGMPTELGKLTRLQTLVLGVRLESMTLQKRGPSYYSGNGDPRTNLLDGEIPTEIGNLGKLKVLSLSQLLLSGSIPSEIGRLTQLENLALDDNFLNDTIPREMRSFTSLSSMNVRSNLALCGSLDRNAINPSASYSIEDTGIDAACEDNPFYRRDYWIESNPAFKACLSDASTPSCSDLSSLVDEGFLRSSGGAFDLSGTIPTLIGMLTQLTRLNLLSPLYSNYTLPGIDDDFEYGDEYDGDARGARLQGTLPVGMKNRFWGRLPSELGKLSVMTSLTIRGHHISGGIPSDIGKLKRCATLDLSHNILGKALPTEMGLLTELQTLYVVDNTMEGTIPSQIGKLRKCLRLKLHGNGLSGTIPAAMSGLTQLRELDLGGRDDACSTPDECSDLDMLTGTIPAGIKSLTKLRNLNLRANALSGTIPHAMGSLTDLRNLDLRQNNLGGTIPEAMGGATMLRSLNLRFNKRLQGTLPVAIGQLTALRNLDLRADKATIVKGITGSLPSTMGQLTALRNLDVRANKLRGTLPLQMKTSLKELVKLDLGSNALTGVLARDYGFLFDRKFVPKLTRLDLSENKIKGRIQIPDGLTAVTRLGYKSEIVNAAAVDASTSDDSQSGFAQLEELLLDGNLFTGSIPTELSMLTTLTDLFLGNNTLSGSIPSELGTLQDMIQLVLEMNSLSGSIPASFSNLAALTNMNLNSNAFSGWALSAMSGLSSLTYLDLCCSAVSGAMPDDVGALTTIKYLMLDHNPALGGTLSTHLGRLTSLEFLYIAQSDLEGIIPTEFGMLTALKRLSVLGNTLAGWIPTQLGYLTSLQEMDLRYNSLSGSLPTEFGQLTAIGWLWLDSNSLTGSMPSEMAALTTLNNLTLSDNSKLCGAVPDGMKFERITYIYHNSTPSLCGSSSTLTCKGICDALEGYNKTCYCDERCKFYNDCCSDYFDCCGQDIAPSAGKLSTNLQPINSLPSRAAMMDMEMKMEMRIMRTKTNRASQASPHLSDVWDVPHGSTQSRLDDPPYYSDVDEYITDYYIDNATNYEYEYDSNSTVDYDGYGEWSGSTTITINHEDTGIDVETCPGMSLCLADGCSVCGASETCCADVCLETLDICLSLCS